MTSRFSTCAFLLASAAALGACSAPEAPADDGEMVTSAVGPGQPAIRRSFVFLPYGVPGLERVLIHRSEHDSSAGRGNYVRYDVTAFGGTAVSATCFTTEVGREGREVASSSLLTGVADTAGKMVLASRPGPTHATYTENAVISIDFRCFLGQAPYFHVQCSEATTSGSFTFVCSAR